VSHHPRRAFIVSHTHWDLEWYEPWSRFRVNLAEVVGRVLDALEEDTAFRHFALDGQTAVLEDHLSAVPADSGRIRRLVRSGRLALGPWYILPDEFLVSGEATVRNLLRGHATARDHGGVQKVGYMPDSFGHIAQLPQLLRLAGIDSFIFTRGLGNEADELGWLFRWQAPDGSEVLAVNQCDGYCNAAGLGFTEIWHAHTRRRVNRQGAVAKLDTLFKKMSARPGAEPALLNNGCDHFPPQQDFVGVLDALREAFPHTTFHHGSFADFLAAVRETPDDEHPLHTGELLGGRDHLILSGVWSTRLELKQANEYCQGLLTRQVEPLYAAAHFRHGERWPGGLLDEAWRDLLRNHPHDSICGCSTDEVHREMETRFGHVSQTGEQLLARLLNHSTPMFAATADDDRSTAIDVANPLPRRRTEIIERIVVLQPLGYDLDNLRVVDQAERPVPFRVKRRHFLERFWGVDYRARLHAADQRRLLDDYLVPFRDRFVGTEADRGEKDCFLELEILARDLPAVGHARFFVTDTPGPTAKENFIPVAAHTANDVVELANEHLVANLHPDGTIDLTDRDTGRTWQGLNRLQDTGDVGDEYDVCPVGAAVTTVAGRVTVDDATDLLATATAHATLTIPVAAATDRQGRSNDTVDCPVSVQIRLAADSRRLDITTTLDNRARDHRLQAVFPTGIATTEVVSDGHFHLDRRPLQRTGGEHWDQPAPAEWPQQDFSLLADDRGGLALLNRGLPEFSTHAGDDGTATLHLTLLRCVGWLSRDDFATRNETNAGPTLATPDAQAPGPRTARYALLPFAGEPLAAGVKVQSEAYRTPPPSHQGVADGARPVGESFLAQQRPEVAITAIKCGENTRALVVRLVNLSDGALVESLTCGLPVLEAEKTGILETTFEVDRDPVAVIDGGRRVRVPLAPHEIATVLLVFAEEDV